MPERVILKLGGSVITEKSGPCRVDRKRLAEISQAVARRKTVLLTLVHGAGSCGHPQAQRYRIQEGVDGSNRKGIAVTHAAVAGLNRAVVQALRREGVEAMGFHPLHFCVAKDGRIAAFPLEPLERLQDLGITPVLHGDVVADRARGASIVSGDQLVTFLATGLRCSRVGIATDVKGVLGPGGEVVHRIDAASARNLSIRGSGARDVTGGMRGKVEELLRLATQGIESHIFHVSRIGAFLDGKDHGGTIIGER
ncbi:MAG: isopentenyl phosphate kinase [Methanomicrobia archaeon]|nr:isopentenyl phosphate kinase [Methanomicrobiales archaeon]MBS1194917.1 isopentenyl phosphate kinase [Methanomicrobia archaeon]MDD1634024.1 isopentenyl phosphate kinase family protein [Methanomicrobiales archaeon]MDD1639807.1 isopentenyl phosphate kinase family protein [Methanomicrobiales archaeon]MDD1646319.1 isopentenyl phosphate kinase family protein [Methanomicrobiales archaeon]